jgi:hypothetical protein
MPDITSSRRLQALIRDLQWGPYERIYLSDTLIPSAVTTALKQAVKALEDVPETEQDWHPGSDGRVLDLVHPSICPLIFKETWGTRDDGEIGTFEGLDSAELNVPSIFISQRFQWLPSDFSVQQSGEVKLKSPYINNISPENHDSLVPIIERVMGHAVPLWEHVLSALRGDPVPPRVRSIAPPGQGQSRAHYFWAGANFVRVRMEAELGI